MGWAEALASRTKQQAQRQVFFVGNVIQVEPELVVSCYGGEIMLRSGDLIKMKSFDKIETGMTVAMVGNIFSGEPGTAKALLLGEV